MSTAVKMKILIAVFQLSLLTLSASAFTGFYQTIDDKTNQPKSIVYLYEQDGMLRGKIVALYTDGKISETILKPVRIAEKVKDKPHTAGLVIIWDMKPDGKEYRGGKIMDPASGSIYSAVIWQEDPATLKVRGKIGPIGRTQTWNAIKKPAELKDWMP